MTAFPRLIHSRPREQACLTERGDDDLMRLAQSGSHAAFSLLVQRYALRVIRVCSRLAGGAEVGEELAQDVWTRVWQQRERYHPGSDFGGWLVTVALNHSRNHLRRRTVVERHERAERLAVDAAPEQVDMALAAERRGRVHEALSELSPAMREALLMRYGEELTYDEMSSVLGAGESTLRSRIHHGLRLLKNKLEKAS